MLKHLGKFIYREVYYLTFSNSSQIGEVERAVVELDKPVVLFLKFNKKRLSTDLVTILVRQKVPCYSVVGKHSQKLETQIDGEMVYMEMERLISQEDFRPTISIVDLEEGIEETLLIAHADKPDPVPVLILSATPFEAEVMEILNKLNINKDA